MKSALQTSSKFRALLIFIFFTFFMQLRVHKTVSCPAHQLSIKTQLVTYQSIRLDESSRMVGRTVQFEQRLSWFGPKTTFLVITNFYFQYLGNHMWCRSSVWQVNLSLTLNLCHLIERQYIMKFELGLRKDNPLDEIKNSYTKNLCNWLRHCREWGNESWVTSLPKSGEFLPEVVNFGGSLWGTQWVFFGQTFTNFF